ncbi:hypothetical protein ACN38_g377 [Penicillium nordicum]|uniref:Uncharacterized protein n=1 Tax=Penicillium nordicum TaxID=229535 RepID=A0A0M8PAU8_9EURO|nr:hypothetical protein ACN38_g377 [Penicillium nordicum]
MERVRHRHDVHPGLPLSLPLPLPVSSRLALVNQTDGEVLYEAALAENATDPNPLTGEILNAPQFFAFGPSFKINASVVYANHGRLEDFEDPARADVSVVGKIAIVKFGLPGSKFYETLQQTGIAGWIVYRDPEMDGEITEANGYIAYPDGPARAPSSVFRQNGAHPGKDSEPVPAMAISYADAVPILKAVNGIGPRADDLGSRWQGGQLGYRGVEYNLGASPPNIVLDMQNE